jgi:hypothetical protein
MIEPINFDGVTMAVRATGITGVVDGDTRIGFVQRGSRVMGRYRGGRIFRGCLAGTLTFRFA